MARLELEVDRTKPEQGFWPDSTQPPKQPSKVHPERHILRSIAPGVKRRDARWASDSGNRPVGIAEMPLLDFFQGLLTRAGLVRGDHYIAARLGRLLDVR